MLSVSFFSFSFWGFASNYPKHFWSHTTSPPLVVTQMLKNNKLSDKQWSQNVDPGEVLLASTPFAGEKPIWHAWASPVRKFLDWLAIRLRVWTADKRHRHGSKTTPIACCVTRSLNVSLTCLWSAASPNRSSARSSQVYTSFYRWGGQDCWTGGYSSVKITTN